MKKTGKLLKDKRESKKISINEVTVATKISPRVIKAMEEGNLDKLPAPSFVRGFIKTYAEYLNLNADDLLNVFYEETGLKKQPPITEERIQDENTWLENLSFIRKTSTTTKAVVISSIVILILIIITIKKTMDKYEQEKVTATSESIVGTSDPIALDGSEAAKSTINKTADTSKSAEKLTDTNKAKPVEKVEIPEKENKIPETEPTIKPPPAVEEKKPEPVIENKPDPVVEKKPTPSAEEKPEPTTQEPSATNPQEVIVEALDYVEVSFRIDGGKLQTIDLKPDQLHTIKAKKYLAVDVSDAGAVNIIHNGKDKGVPGNIGQTVKLKFP